MKTILPRTVVAALLLLVPQAPAKDEPVKLEACPPGVRAIIAHYAKHGKLEEVALDRKRKSGGPPVYEAKFSLNDGRRIELHMSPEGLLLKIEPKN